MDEQSKFYDYIGIFVKIFIHRPLKHAVGIIDFKYISHKVSDYFADYKIYEDKQDNVQAPIYVCNHHAACDIFVL